MLLRRRVRGNDFLTEMNKLAIPPLQLRQRATCQPSAYEVCCRWTPKRQWSPFVDDS